MHFKERFEGVADSTKEKKDENETKQNKKKNHDARERQKGIDTHTQREDQCEWHRMASMTGPDCAVMCNLINTHTHTHVKFVQVERVCPLFRV